MISRNQAAILILLLSSGPILAGPREFCPRARQVLRSSLFRARQAFSRFQRQPGTGIRIIPASDGESDRSGLPSTEESLQDVAFGEDPLQKLDIYPSQESGRPVVVFIHGGGWTSGDKGMIEKAPGLLPFFQERDIVLVSVNYRLMHDVDYVAQAEDVAAGTAWVLDHIEEYGGDPEQVFLWGYSAGAHLVALVGSDLSYLDAHGHTPQELRGIASYDVNAYDIPRAIENCAEHDYPKAARALPSFFSQDPDTQWDASPVAHLDSGVAPPPFLLVYATTKQASDGFTHTLTKDQSEHFAAALETAGSSARVEGFDNTHAALVLPFGNPDHEPTRWLEEFLGEN